MYSVKLNLILVYTRFTNELCSFYIVISFKFYMKVVLVVIIAFT